MPAPKFLAGLPKPVLFGIYGAVGGLVGALFFGEPLYRLLEPPKASAQGAPQVAVSASPEFEVFADGKNTFGIQIDRAGFDGPVTVKFEKLPAGVTIEPVTIAAGTTEATATVVAARGAPASTGPVRVVAEAKPDGKPISAETSIQSVVADRSRPMADVFFVLDVTGSMDWAIRGVRDGIRQFAADMNRNNIDFRVGLVAFRDLQVDDDAMRVLRFGDSRSSFTKNVEAFREAVGNLTANGGGDDPESSLEGIAEACQQDYRAGATKVLLFITDAPPKVLDQGRRHNPAAIPEAVRKAAGTIHDKGIDSVHLVVPNGKNPVIRYRLLDTYEPLREAGLDRNKGEFFELADVSAGTGFDRLLDKFTARVAEAAKAKNPEGKPRAAQGAEKPGLKALQSEKDYAEGSEGKLALASAVWTGAIAALVCLVLLAGQHHYLRGTLPAAAGIATGFLGGLAVGLVGGAAGQGLYMVAAGGPILVKIFQVVGWALLGGLAGAGLSLFIPNLKWVHGLAGGAIGGAVGALGFLAVAGVAHEFVGRLVGGLLLGFCIGLMVAVVEAAFRRAWLEVRFGARETITVNLGPEPVKIGGDGRTCTVWARGAAPLALRYFLRDGKVICEDAPTRTESVAVNGDVREVGNVTVTVRTGMSAKPPAGGPRLATPPRPTAPPLPAKKPEPLSLDDDLPVPVAASAPPAPAAAAAPPRPPVPAGTKPPAPGVSTKPPVPSASPKPPAPTASAKPQAADPPKAPRDPDACPGCGRKNPGRPGARYCMMCDQTY